MEGTEEVARERYWIVVRGELDSFTADTEQEKAQRRRNELLTTLGLSPEEVIIIRARSMIDAVRISRTWYAQWQAAKEAEQEETPWTSSE